MMEQINRIELKMDTFGSDMQHVKRAVDNGLKTDLKNALVEELAKFDVKYAGVIEFSWFREFVTDLRNNMFKNFLKLAMVGGGVYVILHFGDVVLKRVIG